MLSKFVKKKTPEEIEAAKQEKARRKEEKRRNKVADDLMKTTASEMEREVKILMLGPGDSGKSTIIKQLRIIFLEGYQNDEDRKVYFPAIMKNVLVGATALSKGAQDMGLEPLPENVEIVDKYANFGANVQWDGNGDETEVSALWRDPAIQAAYARRAEYPVDENVAYFMEELERLTAPEYVPTAQDIVRCRIRTTGIQEMKFDFMGVSFTMVDVGGQRNERRKWFHCFEDVDSIIFCVAANEYDLMLFEDKTKNRMHESLEVFATVWNNDLFKRTSIILFLNKMDRFTEKVKEVDLNVAFPEYTGGRNYQAAIDFIRNKFLAFASGPEANGRQIYPHLTCATDTENVKFVFDAVQNMILRRNVAATGMGLV